MPLRFLRRLAAAAVLLALASGPAADAQSQPPLKIGLVMAFTGLSAVLGQEVNDAVDAFVREHGDTVAGRKVEIIRRDTTGPLPDVAQRVTQELIVNEKVDAIIGPDYTPTAIAMANLSTQAKKPMFVLTAAQTGIFDAHPYVTHLGFSQRQYEVPLALYAARSNLKRVYMLYTNFGPGIDAAREFKDTYTRSGGTVTDEVPFPIATTDFSAFAQRVRAAKPDALWVFMVPGVQPGALLRSLSEVGAIGPGSTMKILDNGGISDEPNLDKIGPNALGVVSSFVYSDAHQSKLNRDFVARVERVDPRIRPDYMAAIAYDAMGVVYRIAAAQNGAFDPDRTMALVRGLRFEGPRGPVQIDPQTRTATQNIYIRRVEKRGDHLVNVEFETYPMVKH